MSMDFLLLRRKGFLYETRCTVWPLVDRFDATDVPTIPDPPIPGLHTMQIFIFFRLRRFLTALSISRITDPIGVFCMPSLIL